MKHDYEGKSAFLETVIEDPELEHRLWHIEVRVPHIIRHLDILTLFVLHFH